MKNLITIVILSTLFAQTTFGAVANANAAISTAYAKLNYKLTSKWDGENVAFKKAAMSEFESDIKKLNVSNDTLMATFLKSSTLSPESKEELQNFSDFAAANDISENEKEVFINNLVQNEQAQGSNFDAKTTWMIIAVIEAIVIITLIVVINNYDDEPEAPEEVVVDVCNDGDESNDFENNCAGYTNYVCAAQSISSNGLVVDTYFAEDPVLSVATEVSLSQCEAGINGNDRLLCLTPFCVGEFN